MVKKLIYIGLFLLLAANVAAQESYVIDSVCVGATRTYAIDGEKGSTYGWKIYDSLGPVDSLANTLFEVVNSPGDTVWGSEATHSWDMVGEFDLLVEQVSLHGCDTIELGRIKVFDLPEALLESDQVVCTFEDIVIHNDTAWNYSALLWTTTGDGTFSDPASLHPVYSLGPNDSINMVVSLILTADGLALNGTCIPAVDTITYYISSPQIDFDVIDPLCFGDSNGAITSIITDAQPPISYSWSGPGSFDPAAENLVNIPAGIYHLTITDANGCMDMDSVEVFDPPLLLTSIDSVKNVSCYGYNDGTIFSSATGGTGPLSYEWTSLSGNTATGDSIYNLPADTYYLTVTDSNLCQAFDTVIVTEPEPLIALIDNFFDVTCYGYNNGAAHVTVTDGTGPYSYSWNSIPAQDSVWAIELGPGEYIATITDFKGCTARDTVYINEPPPLVLSADSLDLRCDGDKPGEIDLTVVGGTPFANEPYYKFEWKDALGNIIAYTEDVKNLAGNELYTVWVEDSLGCRETRQVFINEIPMMQLEASIDSALCYGDLWSVYSTVTEGRPPYYYEWTDTSGLVIETTPDLVDVTSGIYFLTVYDSDTCEVTQKFDLPEPDLLLAEIGVSDSIICVGDEVIISGIPTGGTGTITPEWSGDGAAYLSSTNMFSAFFRDAPPGTYQLIFTIFDEANCDAKDSIELYVYPPDTVSFDTLLCADAPDFNWNSHIISANQDSLYQDVLINQYGCDSVLYLDVKVLFPVYDTDTMYVCENEETFLWYNQNVYANRDSIYYDTVKYVSTGCDSLLLSLEVFTLPVTDTLLDTVLCAGAPDFVWNNLTIVSTHDSIYLDTLVNAYGCDSLLTYDVMVIPPDTFYVDTTFCQDEPVFVWNEIPVYTAYDSIYEARLTNMYGCDSLVNLNVFIIPSTDTIIDTLICQGEPAYAWNNLIILSDHDSIYLDTLVNAAGCDSLLTYNVTVIPPDTIRLDTMLCESAPEFVWNSHTVFAFQDSIYQYDTINQFGCDSVLFLDVKILLPEYRDTTMELCENTDPFTWYSHTILPDRDSIYLDTLQFQAGCDSLRLTLEIFKLPVSDTIIDMVLCEASAEFDWNSHTISTYTDSTYLETLDNVWGCDSTLTLNVTVVPAYKDTSQREICYGLPPEDWYGQQLISDMDSTYVHFMTNPSGCDSILFLEVTILPSTDTTLYLEICEGDTVDNWNGNIISNTSDSIYFANLQNIWACDSTLTLNVSILRPSEFTYFDTVFVSELPYPWNDTLYNAAGTYTEILTNAVGCDSLLTLNLVVINFSELDTAICASNAPFVWNGNPYSASGTYIDTFVNSSGGDSILTLNLLVIEGQRIEDTVYTCDPYYVWENGGGTTYFGSGTYDTIISFGACADTLVLNLFMEPIDLLADPVDVSCYGYDDGLIDLTVTGGIGPVSFVWSNGETTEDISTLTAGTYTVVATDSIGCTDTLEVVINEPDSIVLFETHVDLGDSYDPIGSIDLEVVSGGTGSYTFSWSNGATSEDISGLAAGDYTVVVTDANNCTQTLTVTLTTTVVTTSRMTCLDIVELTCFEELANYPIATTLLEYLALDPAIQVYSDCGLDTASFTYRDSVIVNSLFCYTEARMYTIKDSCGNILGENCVQIVNVIDNRRPNMTCPPTIIVDDGIVPPAYVDIAEFLAAGGSLDDNCGIVSFGQIGTDVSDGKSEPETITRTYEVADYCGNTRTCQQTIEIFTVADFRMECPDLTKSIYECDENLPGAFSTLAQFRAAGGYVYSHPYPLVASTFTVNSDIPAGTCKTITRTYSIENTNGDIVSCTQEFTIEDNTDPILIFPDRYITCNEFVPVYSTVINARRDGNTLSDNCGLENNIYFEDQNQSGTCPIHIERIYSIIDRCGNKTTSTQNIYIIDTIPPVIQSVPGDLTTDCVVPEPYVDYAAFAAAGYSVTDECGPVVLTFMGDSVAGATEPGVIYRTYRFNDNCNFVYYVQKITVNDIINPVFVTTPDPFTLDCEPEVFITLDEFIALGGYIDENCELDSSSFKLISSVTSDSLCPKTYVNTYEIFDMSGNRATTTHTVTVVDVELPVLICPSDDTINIVEALPAPFESLIDFINGGGFASDNCGLDTTSFTLVSADSSITDCEAWVTYTYQIADNCGNLSLMCSQTIFKEDIISPELSCPNDTLVECFTDVPDIFTSIEAFRAAGGTASDNYKLIEDSFTHVKDDTIGTDCPLIITRTYEISDTCGHITRCSYEITISDLVPPVIICPSDSSIECLSDVNSNIYTLEEFRNAGGFVDDNCAIDVSSFMLVSDTLIQTINSREYRRIFSIKDLCGNESSCEQIITLTDTIPPDPACTDITVYLDENGIYRLSDDDIERITAGSTDNCTRPEDLIIDIDTAAFSCADINTGVSLTVTVTDIAGNWSQCVTNITVKDTVPPEALCEDLTLYLDENGAATVNLYQFDNGSYDNCEIDTIYSIPSSFDCTDVGDNTVNLVVIDVSGNRAECDANVLVLDTIPPEVICRDISIALNQNARFTLQVEDLLVGAYDMCGVDSVYLDNYDLDCDNIGTTYITVTAVDVNGNSSDCIAELTIFGNVAPNVLDDSAITVMNVPIEIDIITNDYDTKTNLNISTLGIVLQPANGTVEVNPENGMLMYIPNPGFVGLDVLSYSICDDGIPCVPMCGEAQVYITVLEPNIPPVAVDDYFTTTCAYPTGNVLINDYDPDSDTIRIFTTPVTQPVNGHVIIYENGDFDYVADDNFIGLDSFKYEITDLGIPNMRDTATVYLDVLPDNDCDGVSDWDDIDDDNDGILDVVEGNIGNTWIDSDLDGIPDHLDIDADDDGIVDNVEGQAEGNYIPPTGFDTNHNGWDDAYDPEDGGYEFVPADTDEDSTPDYLDLDSENDHVYDFIEGHDINADGVPDVTRIFVDSDHDGLDDIYDTVFGWNDPNDPFNALGSNSPLQDFDGDGTRDWRDINDEDDEYLTMDEDLNLDGDYSNDDLDLDGFPEYLDKTLDCELFIPEGFSPNGDGVHDFFQILCIQRYPNARLMIFNRNGDKLFDKDHYGNLDYWGSNDDAWWWGNSQNAWTIGQTGGLPAGNYVYVLELGNGRVEKSTVMINY